MSKIIPTIYILMFMSTPFLVQAENFEPLEYSGVTTQEWVNILAGKLFNSNNRISNDRKNLTQLENNLLVRIKSDSNNPALYFLLGRVKHGFLSMRVGEIRHLGRELALKDERYVQLKKEITKSYKKALELDDEGYPIQLGGKMLAIIGGSIFSNSNMRVNALRKELNRPWGESESFEYNTYSRIVTAYIDEKRYDEALSVINEIEEKFPSMQSEIESGRQRIWGFQQAAQAAEVEQEETSQPTKPKKPEPAIAKPQEPLVQQQPVVKAEVMPQKPKTKQESDNNQVIIIGIVLAVLLLVGFMVSRRKKK